METMNSITNLEELNAALDKLIDDMEIIDTNSGFPPISNKARNIVKLQLITAQLIAQDTLHSMRINKYKQKSHSAIANELSRNWIDNIRTFSKIIMKNPSFRINISQILEAL